MLDGDHLLGVGGQAGVLLAADAFDLGDGTRTPPTGSSPAVAADSSAHHGVDADRHLAAPHLQLVRGAASGQAVEDGLQEGEATARAQADFIPRSTRPTRRHRRPAASLRVRDPTSLRYRAHPRSDRLPEGSGNRPGSLRGGRRRSCCRCRVVPRGCKWKAATSYRSTASLLSVWRGSWRWRSKTRSPNPTLRNSR